MPQLEAVKWSKDREREFLHYVHEELTNAMGDRAPLEKKWESAIVQWRASMPEGVADFPWEGAPEVEFPLTAIHSDPVIADFQQTLHAPEDYWTPVARREDRVPHATALREALTAVDRRFLGMRRINGRALLDMVVLGTAIYKNHWKKERKTVRDYGPDGRIEKVVKRLSQPAIEHVPLQHFYFPANAWSLDPDAQGGARWQAHEFYTTASELRVMASGNDTQPRFDREAVKRVLAWEEDVRDNSVDQRQRELNTFKPHRDYKITLYEVWARFDTDGDGVDEDIVCVLHKDSLTLLRTLHNPSLHGKWPFEAVQYLPNFGIYGLGMSEIDEWAQSTATTLLNAQIWNALLANTRMYGVPRGMGILPNEGIYPGKIWPLGPDEKIQEVRLGEVYPSLMQTISALAQFSEMRTGVSELRQGNITGLPSRTPASTVLSILREGNKRFDMILSNFRDTHSRMGLRMVQNLAQELREDPIRWQQFFERTLGPQDAQLVLEALSEPIHEMEESFGLTVTATSAQVNKEVHKQALVGLMQIVTQTYGGLVQTAMLMAQVQDPTVQATAQASYKGGVELLQRLLEEFDIQNPSQYLPNLQALSGSLSAQAAGANPATAGLMMPAAGDIPPQLLQQQQLGGLLGF